MADSEASSSLWLLARLSIAFVGLVSPIFVALYLVVFRGRGVHGRWLFLVAGPVLAYTVLWVVILVFVVPASFVVVFIAPGTKELLDQVPFWYPAAAWAVKYSNELLAIVCGSLAAWLALHIWPRWPALLQALAQRRSTSPSASSVERTRGGA